MPRTPTITIPANARMTRQRRAVVEAIQDGGGSFTAVEVYDRARRARGRSQPGHRLPDDRPVEAERRRAAARGLGAWGVRPLQPGPPPSPHLPELRLGRGDGALRGSARGRAPPAPRLHADLARVGRLRHLRRLPGRLMPVATAWIALPLAGLTVISTLAGGLVALRARPRPDDRDRAHRRRGRGGGALRRAARGVRERRRRAARGAPRGDRVRRLLPGRARARPPPPRRRRARAGARPGRGAGRGGPRGPQLHRRPRHRPGLRPQHRRRGCSCSSPSSRTTSRTG